MENQVVETGQNQLARVLAVGIDTLVLNFYGRLREGMVGQLEDKKVASQGDAPSTICIRGVDFSVSPSAGGKTFRYLLKSSRLDLKVSAGESEKTVAVQAYLHSQMLWENGKGRGWESAALEARNIVFEICNIRKEQISRVDQCADLAGLELQVSDIENFVSRAVYKGPYNPAEKKHPAIKQADSGRFWYYGKNFTGFSFGKGDTVARCYCKTKEIAGTDKQEMFEEVWGVDSKEELGEVWRVEYQLRREALKELGINTVIDLLEHDSTLWEKLTNSWLNLKVPGRNKQRTRWIVDSRWVTTQEASGQFEGRSPIVIKKTFSVTKKQLWAQIAGCCTSLAAIMRLQGHKDFAEKNTGIEEIGRGLRQLFAPGQWEESVIEKTPAYQAG